MSAKGRGKRYGGLVFNGDRVCFTQGGVLEMDDAEGCTMM